MARIHLTGGLRVEGPRSGFGESQLPGHQGRIVFVALAITRQPISHGGLADIVWDGAPPRQWRSALAAIVSKTRSLVASTGLDATSTLASEGGSYVFIPPTDAWIDLEHASRCLDRAEGALRHGDPLGAAPDATVASSILRRPLLAGVDCLWLDETRRQLEDGRYRSFIALSTAWNRLGDHRLAATTAEAAITTDPYREIGHRRLIEAERAQGDGGAARRAFQRCERQLAEIGAQPSPDTRRIVSGEQD